MLLVAVIATPVVASTILVPVAVFVLVLHVTLTHAVLILLLVHTHPILLVLLVLLPFFHARRLELVERVECIH